MNQPLSLQELVDFGFESGDLLDSICCPNHDPRTLFQGDGDDLVEFVTGGKITVSVDVEDVDDQFQIIYRLLVALMSSGFEPDLVTTGVFNDTWFLSFFKTEDDMDLTFELLDKLKTLFPDFNFYFTYFSSSK